jgi:hypothetical protein
MKKQILPALIALLLSLASCGDEITQVVEPNTFTQNYRIYADDMSRRSDDFGVYYEYEFREPYLTDEVFDYGILQAFLYYNKDGRDTFCPLPFSDFLVSGNHQWEEYFTVEFQPGNIKFIQKISDYSSDAPIAEYYDVLIRFLW